MQAVMPAHSPRPCIELPKGGWVRLSFDSHHNDFSLQAGKIVALPSGLSVKIPDEGISLDPFDDATLKLFESALPPGISIKLANTILEIPKEQTMILIPSGVCLPIGTRVVLPAADPAKAERQTALWTTEETVFAWLPDGGSFVLGEEGPVTLQPKSP